MNAPSIENSSPQNAGYRYGYRKMPSAELLRSILSYDTQTGRLTWLPRPSSMFPSERTCKTWNTRYAGTEALGHASNGYKRGPINKVLYWTHRVIWKMHYDAEPEIIDHINGDSSDNRIENLRNTDQSFNKRNARLPSNNTSGYIGVSFDKSRGKWMGYMKGADGKTIRLGRFDTAAEAAAARERLNAKHGYGQNHGK